MACRNYSMTIYLRYPHKKGLCYVSKQGYPNGWGPKHPEYRELEDTDCNMHDNESLDLIWSGTNAQTFFLYRVQVRAVGAGRFPSFVGRFPLSLLVRKGILW